MTKGLKVFTGHWQYEVPTKPERTCEEQREREHEAAREAHERRRCLRNTVRLFPRRTA